MSSQRKFSDVSKAYNVNLASLNEARSIFQNQLAELNGFVISHLKEIRSRHEEGVNKFRFGEPEDYSTQKDGSWINYTSSTRIGIDVRPPSYSRFRNGAINLYFESIFDDEKGRFVFQSRLENQNTVHNNIDESAIEIIKMKDKTKFPEHGIIKTNTAIIYKRELEDGIFDCINQIVDDAVLVCEETINKIFPDSEYQNEAIEDKDE